MNTDEPNFLLKRLQNKKFREEFVSARAAAVIGAQVFNMRKKKAWTQGQLADAADGMKQTRISLIERGDYESFSLSTLRRLAKAFDVALIVEFVSFPKFLRWLDEFSVESVAPEGFAEAPSRYALERSSSDTVLWEKFPPIPKQRSDRDAWGANELERGSGFASYRPSPLQTAGLQATAQ